MSMPALPPGAPQRHIVLPGQAPDGTPILSVLLKRSYRIDAGGLAVQLEHAQPLVPGDRHFGDPMNTTIAHESDHIPFKPATDIVIQANAHAHNNTPVHELTVSVMVGTHRKDIQVIGDRLAKRGPARLPIFTDPAPFTTMPMRYEHAYGGIDVTSDPSMANAYARNHLGRGFVVSDSPAAIDGLELPNIEAPDDRLTPERLSCGHVMHWQRQPMPDGIAWTSKYAQPRASYAGVMPGDRALEAKLRRAYTKAVPAHQQADYAKTALPDMNFAFFNGASRGLVRPYLQPAERLAFRNLHQAGDIITTLPATFPAISLDIGQGPQPGKPAILQTAMFRLDAMEFDLVWRAAFPYAGPDSLPRLRRLHVEIAP